MQVAELFGWIVLYLREDDLDFVRWSRRRWCRKFKLRLLRHDELLNQLEEVCLRRCERKLSFSVVNQLSENMKLGRQRDDRARDAESLKSTDSIGDVARVADANRWVYQQNLLAHQGLGFQLKLLHRQFESILKTGVSFEIINAFDPLDAYSLVLVEPAEQHCLLLHRNNNRNARNRVLVVKLVNELRYNFFDDHCSWRTQILSQCRPGEIEDNNDVPDHWLTSYSAIKLVDLQFLLL